MTNEPLIFKNYPALTPALSELRANFGKQNFDIEGAGDPDWIAEVDEWFWQAPDLFVFAYLGNDLVGTAILSKREVSFLGEPLLIAGFGGLTVVKHHRGKGIGKSLIAERMRIAQGWNADIAFLNTDIEKLGGLFRQFGFVPLGRNYSFIGKSGKVHQDDSGMIAPISSTAKFAKVANSGQVLFLGGSNI